MFTRRRPPRCLRARRFCCFLRLAAAAVSLVAPAALAATPAAQSADDVCAAGADPCVVAVDTRVAAGARLDFGLRTLRIQNAGVLDFEGGGEVLCGRLEAATSGAAIRARGGASGVAPGATVTLLVRRRCALAPATPCLVDSDCAAAAGGSCSGGDGSAWIDGVLSASAEAPGRLVLRSGGELSLLKPASAAGTRSVSDGGAIELESTGAGVRIAAAVDVSGGGAGSGGAFEAFAAGDVRVEGRLLATGGDYDGGTVTLVAGRDVVVAAEIRTDSTGGAGYGGEIDVAAGRDLLFSGGGATNLLVIGSDGHQSADNIGGDGGIQVFDAGRDILVSRYVRFSADGAAPDGFADTISFVAGGDVVFEGSVRARGRGGSGGGGLLEILADGDVRLASTASIDLAGAAAGGDLVVESGGAFSSSATVDVSGGSGGLGGRVVAVAGGDAAIGGRWSTNGAASALSVGDFLVEACRLRVSGVLANAAASGRNRFVAHHSLVVEASASVLASGSGAANEVRYHGAGGAPVLAGGVSPQALLVPDPSLASCPVCGDGLLEGRETCDDGNTASGDGCSALCQDEGCEADTPGYPDRPLCSDASDCTEDRCDAALHRCVHLPGDCSDGIACTVDSCVDGACVHEGEALRCEDGNACTADYCSAASGCGHVAVAAACDDGLHCNGSDSCRGGQCVVHAGDPCASGPECANTCDETADSCLAAAGTACSDDANPCTDDACDGEGSCVHPANAAACDDGLFCNGADTCAGGRCSVHSGNPCGVGAAAGASGGCSDTCDEAAGSCSVRPVSPCEDDGNPCTLELCGGDGLCFQEAAEGPCDDGDLCTTGDVCIDGACGPGRAPAMAVDLLRVKRGRGGRPARATWSGAFPLDLLEVDPAAVNVRAVLSDALARPLLDATLAAGSLRGGEGTWRHKSAAPTDGGDAPGLVLASLVVDEADALLRFRFKARGLAIGDGGTDQLFPPLSMALVLGDEPEVAPCASSGELACEARRGRYVCRSLP